MGEGTATLLGGHFQNIDCYWGVILINFTTEVQSSNKHELKYVTAIKGKTSFLKMASLPSQVTNDQPPGNLGGLLVYVVRLDCRPIL